MPTFSDHILLFVHGYSVVNVDTYGQLPERLVNESNANGITIDTDNIFLGEYISFHDEVRIIDLARAFQKAIRDKQLIYPGKRFICITHSTGGPVIRTWLQYRFFPDNICPVSHLIMLAPANFGSPLAKLGKKALSRVWSELHHVEAGTGVLDWLKQGSKESWILNRNWINSDLPLIGTENLFPFVITGDYIDRRIKTQSIPFTQEIGSDGVVRTASANLNSAHLVIFQDSVPSNGFLNATSSATIAHDQQSARTAFLVVPKRSHSESRMGIMNSVDSVKGDNNETTINAIFRCMSVRNLKDYDDLCDQFEIETDATQTLVERTEGVPWFDLKQRLQSKYYIHDRYCIIIFRVTDTEGLPIAVYDMTLTSNNGEDTGANNFPIGFMGREQRNDSNPGILTYFLNYDILKGVAAVEVDGKIIREEEPGIGTLGLNIYPYPSDGFVSYMQITMWPTKELFDKLIKKNETVLVDIIFHRLVAKESFELKEFNSYSKNHRGVYGSFRDKPPSQDAVP